MLTMQLGIELRTRGFSIEELRRFHRLRERLLQNEKEFRCVFLIRGPGSFHQLEDIGFYESKPSETPTRAEIEFSEQDTGDGVTEEAVMDAINELMGAKTIIMIAHRITTVQKADAIYLLEKGRIGAAGSYDELLESSAAFRKMAKIKG